MGEVEVQVGSNKVGSDESSRSESISSGSGLLRLKEENEAFDLAGSEVTAMDATLDLNGCLGEAEAGCLDLVTWTRFPPKDGIRLQRHAGSWQVWFPEANADTSEAQVGSPLTGNLSGKMGGGSRDGFFLRRRNHPYPPPRPPDVRIDGSGPSK